MTLPVGSSLLGTGSYRSAKVGTAAAHLRTESDLANFIGWANALEEEEITEIDTDLLADRFYWEREHGVNRAFGSWAVLDRYGNVCDRWMNREDARDNIHNNLYPEEDGPFTYKYLPEPGRREANHG